MEKKRKSDILLELSNIARETETLITILKETESSYFQSTELTGLLTTKNYDSEIDQFTISVGKVLTQEIIKTMLTAKEKEFEIVQKQLFNIEIKEV